TWPFGENSWEQSAILGRRARMAEQLTRDQVPAELTYDLSHVYATPEEFEADLVRADAQLGELARHQGRVTGGAALLALLKARDDLLIRAVHLSAYARGHAQVDGTSSVYQAMSAKVGAFGARMEAALAFIPT